MTTATVRDLRYDFPSLLKRVEAGEEIAIMRRGKLVGTLIPADPGVPKRVRWPDLSRRLQATYGKQVLAPVDSILRQRENER